MSKEAFIPYSPDAAPLPPPIPQRLEDIPSPKEIEMANSGASVEELRDQVTQTNAEREARIQAGVPEAHVRNEVIRTNELYASNRYNRHIGSIALAWVRSIR